MVMPVPLNAYFSAEGHRKALAAYRGFAKGAAWSIPNKIKMYVAAQEACDMHTTTESYRAFESM